MTRRHAKYASLGKALERDNVADPYKVGGLLLTTFVDCDGVLPKEAAIAAGVCRAGEFSMWRDDLIRKGWITHESKYYKHGVGIKLAKYINDENYERRCMVTRDELKSTLRSFAKALEEVLKNDPPLTADKLVAELEKQEQDIDAIGQFNTEALLGEDDV